MKATLKRAVVVAVSLAASAAFAGWTKAGDAEAGFTGTGPAGFKMEGKTKAVEVKDDGTNFSVVVNLTNLETGIGLRDRHMREKYIQVDKYPEATLTVPTASIKVPADGQSVEAQLPGTFTLHGTAKPTTFKYKASCKGGVCSVEGTAGVNINDHGIHVPSYMGITVKPDITVRASFQVKKS